MKILMFTKMALPHIGGVETHIHKVSNILVDRGYMVHVITSNPGPKVKDAKYELISDYKQAYKNFRWYDIVQCHDFEQYIPSCYMTFHGYEGHCPPNPVIVSQRKQIASVVPGVMFVGKYLKTWYDSKNVNEQVIWGGVDPSSRIERKPGREVSVAYVGRISYDKRSDIYQNAASELRSGLTCRFYEDLPNSEVMKVWEQTDIAYANGQLSILEAMSKGVPVVALASNKMVADMLSECPALIMVNTKEEIVEQTHKLAYELGYYDHYSKLSWEFANQNTWETVVNKYEKLWSLK